MSDATPAISIDRLSHRYPAASHDALDGLNLEIQRGERFALLGPNGGGKTTAFRILATTLRPRRNPRAIACTHATDGRGFPTASPDMASKTSPQPPVPAETQPPRLRVLGHDVIADPAAARRCLGVVFQNPSVDIKLTALENLRCQGRLYAMTRREAAGQARQMLEVAGLADRGDDRVEAFSGGMRRRLEIAKALMHDPAVLLLDEPSTGLDPEARRGLWQHLDELRRRRSVTVLWTTHLIDEARDADRLAVLCRGRLLRVDRPAALRDAQGPQVLTLEPMDRRDLDPLRGEIEQRLGPWTDEHRPAAVAGQVTFRHPDGPALVERIAAAWPERLRRIAVGQPTLEDAYLRLIAEADPSVHPAAAAHPGDLPPESAPESPPQSAAGSVKKIAADNSRIRVETAGELL